VSVSQSAPVEVEVRLAELPVGAAGALREARRAATQVEVKRAATRAERLEVKRVVMVAVRPEGALLEGTLLAVRPVSCAASTAFGLTSVGRAAQPARSAPPERI